MIIEPQVKTPPPSRYSDFNLFKSGAHDTYRTLSGNWKKLGTVHTD